MLSLTSNLLNLHMARELKNGFISVLQRHIYVAKCKWKSFNKSDRYPIDQRKHMKWPGVNRPIAEDEREGPSSLHSMNTCPPAHSHHCTDQHTGFYATCYCQHEREILQHLMLSIICFCKRICAVYWEISSLRIRDSNPASGARLTCIEWQQYFLWFEQRNSRERRIFFRTAFST